MSPSGVVFKVQKALGGVRYPVDKRELLKRARHLGADEMIIQVLLLVPDGLYASPVHVSVEVARQLARLRDAQ
jgi:hypothetical protein